MYTGTDYGAEEGEISLYTFPSNSDLKFSKFSSRIFGDFSQNLKNDEVDGVLGHEVAHVANGDMVTMALVQGVVNTFVMFIAHLLTNVITSALRGDDDDEEKRVTQ